MAQINWTPVESSNLKAVSYNPAKQELAIRFKGSPNVYYVYSNITPEKNEVFMTAPSLGSYLAREIKPSHDVTKIEGI